NRVGRSAPDVAPSDRRSALRGTATGAFVRLLIQAAAVSSSIRARASAEVHRQNGLTISILNDSGDTLIVNAYDRVPRPPQQVVTNAAIYGNASLPISIT